VVRVGHIDEMLEDPPCSRVKGDVADALFGPGEGLGAPCGPEIAQMPVDLLEAPVLVARPTPRTRRLPPHRAS